MKWLALTLMLLCSTATAQITVPDTVLPHTPIIASCMCTIPEGSEVKTQWGISSNAFLVVSGEKAHIWAPPGQHKVTTTVVWMQFEVIEIPQADGTIKKIKSVINWDLQSFEKVFTVQGSSPNPNPQPDPKPDPDPEPEPPSDFAGKIDRALKKIGSPSSRKKVGQVYADIAENANIHRDVYKPAIMVDESKSTISSVLSVSESEVWRPFWPELNDAMRERKMDESDTDAFIEAFRELAVLLTK